MPALWPGLSVSCGSRHSIEVMLNVEDDRIAVGDEGIERQHFRRNGPGLYREFETLQQLDCAARPDAPMTQESTLEAQRHLAIAGAHDQRRQKVGDDVVVVAGVERNTVFGLRLRHA